MKNTGGFLPSDGKSGMLHIEVLLLRHDMEERKMPIETPEQKKERQHQEDLRRLQKFRPIDDTFMRGLLKDDIPLAEMILRIILAKPDLILTSCETQADMKRVTGARSTSGVRTLTRCILNNLRIKRGISSKPRKELTQCARSWKS